VPLDRRYKQTEGASPRPEAREQAYARVKLVQARRQARSLQGEERYTSAESGSIGAGQGARTMINTARAADQVASNQTFRDEGSGVFGAGSSSADARKEARFGRGKLDLYS